MRRWGPRGSQFVRQWRLLVLLRGSPRTLKWLADELGVHQRTIRRDLEVLQDAGMPIGSLGRNDESGWDASQSMWFIGHIPEWPKRQATPTEMLRSA